MLSFSSLYDVSVSFFDSEVPRKLRILAIPPHVTDTGPAWEAIPPPVDPNGKFFRAVMIFEDDPTKPVLPENALLTLSGKQYHDIRFVELIYQIEEALDAKYGAPKWKGVVSEKDRRWFVD
jgi:hypothetical protein